MCRCIGVTVFMLLLTIVCDSMAVSFEEIMRVIDMSSANELQGNGISATDKRKLISTLRGKLLRTTFERRNAKRNLFLYYFMLMVMLCSF